MWVYLSFLLPPLLLAAAERASPLLQRLAYWAIGIFLSIFIGLRHQVGCDWNNYLLFFARARSNNLHEALALSDPGYMLLAWLVAQLGLGFGMLNLLAAAAFTVALLIFVRSQPRPALALLVATPVLISIAAMAATRQALAVALVLGAVTAYASGRSRLAAAMLVAAPFFHWTAFLILPLAALVLMRRQLPYWLIVGAGVAAAAAVYVAVALNLPGSPYVLAPIEARGAYFRSIPTMVAVLAGLWAGLRLCKGERDQRLFAYFLAISIFNLAMGPLSSVTLDRLNYYSIPFQMMVFSRLPDLFARGWLRMAAIAAIGAMSVALLAGWLFLTTQTACIDPYSSYLSRPWLLFSSQPEAEWLPCGLDQYGDLLSEARTC